MASLLVKIQMSLLEQENIQSAPIYDEPDTDGSGNFDS